MTYHRVNMPTILREPGFNTLIHRIIGDITMDIENLNEVIGKRNKSDYMTPLRMQFTEREIQMLNT
jgi:hypothetical protein